MENWIPSIIEGLVFLCSLVGILIKTSNRINALEQKQEIIEKRVNDTAVTVTTVQASLSEIKTSLARIETDLAWLKNEGH